MSVTVTCTGVVKDATTGHYYIRFADGTEYEFGDLEGLQTMGMDMESVDTAQKLLVRWWLARSRNASNVNLVVGKKLVLDLSAAAPIKVQ